jgi:hypothetical protein
MFNKVGLGRSVLINAVKVFFYVIDFCQRSLDVEAVCRKAVNDLFTLCQ